MSDFRGVSNKRNGEAIAFDHIKSTLTMKDVPKNMNDARHAPENFQGDKMPTCILLMSDDFPEVNFRDLMI